MSDFSNEKNIVKPAFLLTVVSMISLAFSFIQESVFAFFFGAGAITDAYTVATQIPLTLFALISTAINTVVIPCYSKVYYGKGAKAAERYASNLMTVVGGISFVCIVVCEIFAKYLILLFAPGMEPSTQELAIEILRIVLPTILFTELMHINLGILTVHKHFILPALASNILNVVFVVSIVLLSGKYGIYAATIGTLIGVTIEYLYIVILRRQILKYCFVFDIKDEILQQSFKMSTPVFIGIGAAEINKIVDRIVSSFLQAGSISNLNYASKLSSAVSTLLINSISNVVYPEMSKSGTKGEDKGMAEVFSYSLRLFVILIIPVIFGGTILCREIIMIVYCRGAFLLQDVERTAPLFSCYLVCLLFTTFRQTSSRFFYSYGDSRTPMFNSIIGIVINIILNIILGYYLGAFGLALATAISTAIISFLLLYKAKCRNVYIKYKQSLILLLKTIISSCVMSVVIYIVKMLLVCINAYDFESLEKNILFVLISVLIGVLCYAGMLVLLKVDEVNKIVSLIKRKT